MSAHHLYSSFLLLFSVSPSFPLFDCHGVYNLQIFSSLPLECSLSKHLEYWLNFQTRLRWTSLNFRQIGFFVFSCGLECFERCLKRNVWSLLFIMMFIMMFIIIIVISGNYHAFLSNINFQVIKSTVLTREHPPITIKKKRCWAFKNNQAETCCVLDITVYKGCAVLWALWGNIASLSSTVTTIKWYNSKGKKLSLVEFA